MGGAKSAWAGGSCSLKTLALIKCSVASASCLQDTSENCLLIKVDVTGTKKKKKKEGGWWGAGPKTHLSSTHLFIDMGVSLRLVVTAPTRTHRSEMSGTAEGSMLRQDDQSSYQLIT